MKKWPVKRRVQQIALIILVSLVLAGCYTYIYPATGGSHAPGETFGLDGGRVQRYVVWSNEWRDPQVANYIAGLLLQMSYTVVERPRLQQVFDEQKIILLHTPEDTANVLRVGRLVGATQVIFVEVDNIYEERVAVRVVNVETGEVRWSGVAWYPVKPHSHLKMSTNTLAYWAILRATCRVETGSTWKDPSESSNGGCFARGQFQ